jgi:hypothetical protein
VAQARDEINKRANQVRVDINTGQGNQEWLTNTEVAYKIIIHKTEQQKRKTIQQATALHAMS